METERRYIVEGLVVNICRFVLGITFVFSGFVKAVDPLGFYYKMQDYLLAFGLVEWVPAILVLFFCIGLAAVEFCVGVFLCFGIRRRVAAPVSFLLLMVMTPLTLYLALFNPVEDCGCFGDAWVLTNWETFGKNILLLLVAWVVCKRPKRIWRFISSKMEWMVSMYSFLFIFVFSFYCLVNLPVLDFRPYKIGVNIREAMEMPEGAKPSVFEERLVYEKEGERREFTLETLPDSTWTFVERRSVLVEQGYEPPIHNFYMLDERTGADIAPEVLADTNYVFLLVVNHVEEADDGNIDLINEIYDYSVEHGYGFYALTASALDDIELWSDRTGAEYPFCAGEDTELKTIIRSNPGLLLLKGGTIYNKWSDNQLPDEYDLTAPLDRLEIGQMKEVSDLRTITYVLLWFFVPLTLVVAVDLAVIRRRERKRLERQEKEGTPE